MIHLKELYIDVDCDTPLKELIEQLNYIQSIYKTEQLRVAGHIDIALEPAPDWVKEEE